jgi:hypothetical protein
MTAVGNRFQADIDALEGFDDHPENPYRKNTKDAPESKHVHKVRRNNFTHGHNLEVSLYL